MLSEKPKTISNNVISNTADQPRVQRGERDIMDQNSGAIVTTKTNFGYCIDCSAIGQYVVHGHRTNHSGLFTGNWYMG